jgi:hypothetical protein
MPFKGSTVSPESSVRGWRSAARVEIVQNPGIAQCRVFCRTRFDFETAKHSAVNREAVGSNPTRGANLFFLSDLSGARTFGCWPKHLQCRSKTGSQMLAFEVSDLRGFLFRFIEVPFLSARHHDLFVAAAIRPTAAGLAPSCGRGGGDETQPQRRSNRARRS